MPQTMLDGNLYKEMVTGGARNLGNNAEIVNDLNVFPIPDGDTGDNMRMTVEGGVVSAEKIHTVEIGEVAKAVADGMLLSARGNSGVILSQFFGGIAEGLQGVSAADARALGHAFECGVKKAYAAVMTPTEGTILTVAREATAYAVSRVNNQSTVESFLSDFIKEMHASLDRTPELLPVLKEAGVIDSGGAGLVYVVEGMNKILHGETVTAEGGQKVTSQVDTSSFTADSELEFGYCTEFLLQLQNKKVDVEAFDVATISEYLATIGNSIVALKNGSIVKVHVHTMTPGKVFDYCQQFGEFLTLKVENMSLQHSETSIENRYPSAEKKKEDTAPKPRKAFGIVTVASGEGICETFESLGADKVVTGGQTMNPSAEDFINAFDEVNADHIIVLPNNGNIVLAAKQAASLYEGSDIRVVESHTLGEGYAAVSMVNFDSNNVEEVVETMEMAMEGVLTAEVTYAVRDTQMCGIDVHKGDYIGIAGKEILSDGSTRVEAAKLLLERLDMTDKEVLIVICGADATKEDMDQVRAYAKENFRGVELFEIDGKQEVYSFIFVAE